MPFSDDEIIEEGMQSKINTYTLIFSIGFFITSLFTTCYCTANSCRNSGEALILGGLAMLFDVGCISWLANPLLFVAWILIAKKKKSGWVFAIIATLMSLSFLNVDFLIKNEAGTTEKITSIKIGYWLWLSSCISATIGSLFILWNLGKRD